jgi:hypothetical protein
MRDNGGTEGGPQSDGDEDQEADSVTSVHERMDRLEASLTLGLEDIRNQQNTQFGQLMALIRDRSRSRGRSTTGTAGPAVPALEQRLSALEVTAANAARQPAVVPAAQAAMERRLQTLEATAAAVPAAVPADQAALEARLRTLEAAAPAADNTERDTADIDVYEERPTGGYPAATMAAMVERVQLILPRARAENQVDRASRPDTNLKKQIRWSANHYLYSIEDPRILPKLQGIGDELLESLIPYRAWPQRIIPLLKTDFHVIRSYLEHNTETSWIETLILIAQRLHTGSNLKAPWYVWIHLHPKQGELQLGYAQRIRDAFYDLSRAQQRDPHTREHLVRLIRDAFATIWGDIQYHQRSLRTPELIDDLVSRTLNSGRRQIETAVFQQPTVGTTLQGSHDPFPSVQLIPGGNAAQDRAVLDYLPVQNPAAASLPSALSVPQNANTITDPRTDDQTVSYAQGSVWNSASEEALAVGDGNCHNCGKPGHWARDCRQPQQARRGSGFRGGFRGGSEGNSRDRGPEGEYVTITGTLTGRMARVFNAAKRPFQSSGRGGTRGRPASRGNSSSGRGGRRQFAITDEDLEVEAMDYGVTNDNPFMVNDLLNNNEETWDDHNAAGYDEGIPS